MIETDPEEAVAYRAAVTEQQEVFSINSEDRANWLLKKIREKQTERQTIKAQADAMLKAIDNDLEALDHLYGYQLECWAREEIAKRGKSRSLKLWQGTLAVRSCPAALKLVDPRLALEAAQAYGVGVVPSLDTKAFREFAEEHLKDTGEVLPGIEFVGEREAFSFRFPTSKGQEQNDQD